MNELKVKLLSKRDLERLSTYLDGELSARQIAKLEARLEREPSLREALAELRQTAQLLRSMPQVNPPKCFTLTPEMLASRPGKHKYPVLKLATALAAAAFVFVIGVDFLGSTKDSAISLADSFQRSVAEAPAMEADVEVGDATGDENAGMAPEEAAEPLAEFAVDAGEAEYATEEEGIPLTQLSGTEMAEVPAEAVNAAQDIVQEESDAVEKTSEGEEHLGEWIDEEAGLENGVGAEAESTLTASIENEAAVSEAETMEGDRAPMGIEPIRLLEIGLAILCIVLISATLKLRALSK